MRALVASLLIATPVFAAGLTDDGGESDRYWSRQQRVGPKADTYPDVSADGLARQGITLTSPSANADPSMALPIYDAEGDCRAAFSGLDLATCIREDQAAYNFTRAFWSRLPESSRRKCAAMQKPKQMKYVLLQACVQGEMQLLQVERDRAAPPRFRY